MGAVTVRSDMEAKRNALLHSQVYVHPTSAHTWPFETDPSRSPWMSIQC